MLPARNRMRRSAEFSLAVKNGVRSAQPDIVVHARRASAPPDEAALVGLIVTKAVGGAVDRHRVARRLRHAARSVMTEFDPADRVVIRALPSSCEASVSRLEQQLRAGVRRVHELMERRR